jgi:exonuclease VII large subunit
LQTLERGYAIVRTESHVVTDASSLAVGGAVDVRVASGSFDARVEEVRAE